MEKPRWSIGMGTVRCLDVGWSHHEIGTEWNPQPLKWIHVYACMQTKRGEGGFQQITYINHDGIMRVRCGILWAAFLIRCVCVSCVCMCVYVFICTCVWICICMCTYVWCVCGVCICIHICMRVYMYVCMHICILVWHVYVCMHRCVCMNVCMYVYVCVSAETLDPHGANMDA